MSPSPPLSGLFVPTMLGKQKFLRPLDKESHISPSPKSGRREFWKRPFIQRYWSNEKMRFQSFFMLMTNQPSFFASS